MRQLSVRIETAESIKPDAYRLGFSASYIAKKAEPGQFLHIKIDNKLTLLRRPFSIHKIEGGSVYILFKVKGKGTKILSQYKKGDILDVIGPLGNGFNYQLSIINYQLPILVAGGIGAAPLLFLAEKLAKNKKSKIPALPAHRKNKKLVLLGARSKSEILCKEEFKKLGYKVLIATEDGSQGFKGKVTDLLKNRLQAAGCRIQDIGIYACGPKEMFFKIKETIKDFPHINCQVSFEQFMGCGLGVCCGCSINTVNGYRKVCRDGPVFDLRKI